MTTIDRLHCITLVSASPDLFLTEVAEVDQRTVVHYGGTVGAEGVGGGGGRGLREGGRDLVVQDPPDALQLLPHASNLVVCLQGINTHVPQLRVKTCALN